MRHESTPKIRTGQSAPERDAMIQQLLTDGRLTVDEHGQVRSTKSNTPDKPMGVLTSKGYLRTGINYKGQHATIMIHRVVCIAFHGLPTGDRTFVNHKNGVKTDNRPDNLEWMSNSENMEHARVAGLHAGVGRNDGIRDGKGRFGRKYPVGQSPKELRQKRRQHPAPPLFGEDSPTAKLNTASVARIKLRLAQGAMQVTVAKEFGVSTTCIGSIALGKTWSHVEVANEEKANG